MVVFSDPKIKFELRNALDLMKIFPISKKIHKVDLVGSFDAEMANELFGNLGAPLPIANSYLIIDLAAVSFIDDAALSALANKVSEYHKNAGEIYLVNLLPPVKIILEATNMRKFFCVLPTAVDALTDIHTRNEKIIGEA